MSGRSRIMRGMSDRRSPFDKCTDRARHNLRRALALSIYRGHPDIQPIDLVDAISNDNSMGTTVLQTSQLPDRLPTVSDESIEASPMARHLMDQSAIEASKLEHKYPGSEHQLLAITQMHPEVFSDAVAVRREVLEILGHL